MATRFVRVDLSETARDFRPIAVEPGVPMLDRSGANARIMFRWLGGMVAEPVWDGVAVGYYVRDDQGGRLEDVIVQPASSQDIATLLKDDMSKLCQRLEQSKAETTTERTLRKIVMQTFEELTKNPNRSDLDSYFFRYRDVLGNWRLIWCWGYQRQDFEPAANRLFAPTPIAICYSCAAPAKALAARRARASCRCGREKRPTGKWLGLPCWRSCYCCLGLAGGRRVRPEWSRRQPRLLDRWEVRPSRRLSKSVCLAVGISRVKRSAFPTIRAWPSLIPSPAQIRLSERGNDEGRILSRRHEGRDGHCRNALAEPR